MGELDESGKQTYRLRQNTVTDVGGSLSCCHAERSEHLILPQVLPEKSRFLAVLGMTVQKSRCGVRQSAGNLLWGKEGPRRRALRMKKRGPKNQILKNRILLKAKEIPASVSETNLPISAK
jgi:hypothetical protein